MERIKVTFRNKEYSFNHDSFTDLDSWYEEKYSEIEGDYFDKVINKKEHDELIEKLIKMVDYIFGKI